MMSSREIRFSPSVSRDLQTAERFYKGESGQQLADDFYAELLAAIQNTAEFPLRNHFDVYSGARRVILKRFPYHFLYDTYGDFIFVFVVRHNKRKENFGLKRKR